MLAEIVNLLIIPRHPYYEPMTIKIDRSLLPRQLKRHRYMYDNGRVDYLGQILVQLSPRTNIDGKYRTPQDVGKLIPPLTQSCRGGIINSRLTLEILSLDYKPYDTHPRELERMLKQHGIELIWV